MKRIRALAGVVLVFVIAAAGTAAAQSSCTDGGWNGGGINLNCSFTTSGQSIYGLGLSQAGTAVSLGTSWNVSGSGGGIYSPSLFGVSLGDYGAEVSGQTSGNVALNLDAHADGGSVNATINSGVTLSLPTSLTNGQVHPGDLFTIKSTYTPGANSGFSTTAPSVGVGASFDFRVQASVGATVCVVECTGFSGLGFDTGQIHQSIFTYNENPSNIPSVNNAIDNSGLSLFGVNLTNLANGANQLTGGLVNYNTTTGMFSANIGPPEPPNAQGIFTINGDLNPNNLLGLATTSTTGAGGILYGGGTTNNDIMQEQLDLTKLLAALAGPEIPPPDGKLGDLLPAGSPFKDIADQVGYNLATVTLSDGIKFSQQYVLNPNAPTITLKVTETGTQGPAPAPQYYNFQAGQSLTLAMPNFNPDGSAPSISITPQISVNPTFTTNSGVVLDPTLEFSALGLSVGPVSLGPLIDQKFSLNTPQLTIDSKSFQLGGFADANSGPSSSALHPNLSQSNVISFNANSAIDQNGNAIPGLHFQILTIASNDALNIGTSVAPGTFLQPTLANSTSQNLPGGTVQYESAAHFFVLQGSTIQGNCGTSTSPCANIFLQRDVNAPPVSGRPGDPSPLTYFFLTNNSSLKGVTVYNAQNDWMFFNPNDTSTSPSVTVVPQDVATVTNSTIVNNGNLEIANTTVTLNNSKITFDHLDPYGGFTGPSLALGGVLTLNNSQLDMTNVSLGGAERVPNVYIETDASILGHIWNFTNGAGTLPAELDLQNGSTGTITSLGGNGTVNLSGGSTLTANNINQYSSGGTNLVINLDKTSTLNALFISGAFQQRDTTINNLGGTVNLGYAAEVNLNGTGGTVNFLSSTSTVDDFTMTGTSNVKIGSGITLQVGTGVSMQAANFLNLGTISGQSFSDSPSTLSGPVDNFGTIQVSPLHIFSSPSPTALNIAGVVTNEASGNIQVDSTSTLNVSSINQLGGSTVVNGTLTTTNGLVLNGGTLSGTGLVNGTVTNAAGVVAPGNSPGTLTLSGNYIQDVGGTLQIQIASLLSFDQLLVGGTAHLDGTLDVLLANGYTPTLGDTFTFLKATGGFDPTADMFSNLDFTFADGSALPFGYTWDLIYGTTSVGLQWSRVDDTTPVAVSVLDGAPLPPGLGNLPTDTLPTDIADAYDAYCAAHPTVCSGGVTGGEPISGFTTSNFVPTPIGPNQPPPAVPEPPSMLLIASGIVAVIRVVRRK